MVPQWYCAGDVAVLPRHRRGARSGRLRARLRGPSFVCKQAISPPRATCHHGAVDPEHRAANLLVWDERAPIHARSAFYSVEAFVADPASSRLHPGALGELGQVRGRSLVHLQCHLGVETLSWARLGARRVVGLDFSSAAIEQARTIAGRCGLGDRARFVEADVYDAVRALAGEAPFDIVYVSVGAVCWLPSIRRWADQVAALLAPGGVVYVHPSAPAIRPGAQGHQRIAAGHGSFVASSTLRYRSGKFVNIPSTQRAASCSSSAASLTV